MFTDHVTPADRQIAYSLRQKIDNLTKPKGSLGRLEEVALQVGIIQQSLTPRLRMPHNILFAADHGITREQVSLSPRAITWQQMLNFLEGGAAINYLCRLNGFTLVLVDAGVDHELPYGRGILNRSKGRGTASFLQGPAMDTATAVECLEEGAKVVDEVWQKGCNVVSFGEMGIGNTSASSLYMHFFAGIPLPQCVGAGSGLDERGIAHKSAVLHEAARNYRGDGTPLDLIRWFGGFEMVMAIGGMLQAARRKMLVLIDGFIMTACLLAAARLHPAVTDYCLCCHEGDEAGHKLLLDSLHARPLLKLGMRLGEGTGAVCAYPLVQAAVHMLSDMDTFSHASITKYF